MPQFVTVAQEGSIAEGQGTTLHVGGHLIALFLHDGTYHAINDLCPHMGASLGAGQVDEQGAVVCPWHGWRFCVRDGTWCDNPSLSIDAYEVRVKGGEIQVALPPPPPEPSDAASEIPETPES